MRIRIAAVAALTMLAGAQVAHAQQEREQLQDMLQKNNCLACHYIDKRKYGPNFIDVAEKYRGGGVKARDQLANKIRKGGAGVWGQEPMPAQPQVTVKDAKLLADLILALPAQDKTTK